MKGKNVLLNIILYTIIFIVSAKGQSIQTTRILDWNNISYSGFYESTIDDGHKNTPIEYPWFWGINVGHTLNQSLSGKYNGQILFATSWDESKIPEMYIRSTNHLGKGIWAKVLHNRGDQTINGTILQSQNNQWLSPALIQIGRQDISIYNDRSVIGVTNGNLHLDSYSGKGLYLNYYQEGGGADCSKGLMIAPNGNIGIGTSSPSSKLDVNGTIRAKEVKIEATGWSDYVFADDYALPSLTDVEDHITTHKHLPDIPSEKEVLESGVNVVEMQAKLLQKIEELTLYVIDLKKENKSQGALIESLQEQIKKK